MLVEVIMNANLAISGPSEICRINIDELNNLTILPSSIDDQFLDQNGDINLPNGTRISFLIGGNNSVESLNLTMIADQLTGEEFSEATLVGLNGYWKVMDSERGFGLYDGSVMVFTSTMLTMLDKFNSSFTRTFAGLYQTNEVQDNTDGIGIHIKNLTDKNRYLALIPAGSDSLYSGTVRDPSLLPKNVSYQDGTVFIHLSKNSG